jgi:tetratricopeptide (TPR) repeat protein
MRIATERLEEIRDHLDDPNPYRLFDSIDDQIGRLDDSILLTVVGDLRSKITSGFLHERITALQREGERDPQLAWEAWLQTYVAALTEFKLPICRALAEAEFAFPSSTVAHKNLLRSATRLMQSARWSEVSETFLYLADQASIGSEDKTRLLVSAAEIHLYHFLTFKQAAQLLTRAEQMGSATASVLRGWGEYWFQRDNLDKALDFFRRLVEADPDQVAGYRAMGDVHDRRNNLDAAEEWYREGINRRPGDSGPYRDLLTLYGRVELFETHEGQLMGLLEKATRVAPEDEASMYSQLGNICQQNKRHEDALRWFDKAISVDAEYMPAYVEKAFAFKQAEDYAYAASVFADAIRRAPTMFDPYWGMALLSEDQGNWADALHWFEESLPRRPPWEPRIKQKIGEAYSKLGRLSDAERTLFSVVRSAGDEDQDSVATLQAIADQYRDSGNPDDARRIYERLREIKGPDFEGSYQNLVGNLKYFQADYAGAAASYRLAVAADPADSVFKSNLAFALENLDQPESRADRVEEAIALLSSAAEIDPDTSEYQERLAALNLERDLLARYDAAELYRGSLVLPIRLQVSPDFMHSLLKENSHELGDEVQALIAGMRNRILSRFGVAIPGIRFAAVDGPAEPGAYVIQIMETTVATGTVPSGSRFLPRVTEELRADVQIDAEPTEAQANPELGIPGIWVAPSDWSELESAGINLWQIMEFPLRHLERVLEMHLGEFVDHDQAPILDETEKAGDALSVSRRQTALIRVMRGLAREAVPITELEAIQQILREEFEQGATPVAIMERCRKQSRIRDRLPGNTEGARRVELNADFVATLKPVATDLMVVSRSDCGTLLAELAERQTNDAAVVVKDARLRPFVRALTSLVNPRVPVLAEDEVVVPTEAKEGSLGGET